MADSNSTRTQILLQLSGYQIIEEIYRGTRTIVYRAVQIETQRTVVIKVLHQDYPSFSELVQFRNQYTVTKNLPISGIVQPLSLESLGNSYALVMEDLGSISLEQYLQQQPLSLTETLAIAVQLAEILHHLHQHRVVHKDIKPANILIHPDSKQLQLIDFSIASLLPKETQTIQSPNVLEGTLAYLAPEQTGRMNRGIDYRVDFYALGITLYQLLTRQLPFVSEDPLELIHSHIAKVPMSVNQVNPGVPPMVAAIVAKLIAKNAEERYQSALGLKYDLEHCLVQYKEIGAIAEFILGERDLSDRFIIPEKLYGRESEVQVLLEAFERVAAGTTELMLVAGFSGIGKTAVVNEVHKPIVRQRGYFIKGKFDQFNRNIPLSAFVQAFRDLVGQLHSESDAQLQTWKTLILQALKDNAQVIIELIPELERIIGTQPPAPELFGTAAQNRFNLLFQKFIQVFTQAEHPLVMFLDDLQWADSASMNLIQVLMTETNTGYLLLLGAYRDNEVFAAHPLMFTLEGLEKAGATINTITLQPLSYPSLNHLIADTFHTQEAVVQQLTELVMQKTLGNPFFVTQFLKALYQDQLITFDYHAGCWQCDIVQVRDAALTDDVVELMAMQLRKLPTLTQDILKLAACIGAQFDLATLAIVSEQSQTEVATALWKALQEGLVLPQSVIYKFYLGDREANQHTPNETLHYKFLHDRIQQAAYSLIPEEHKQTTHWQIGQLLLHKSANSKREERLFEIVNHLNIGRALISQPQQREDLAQLNLEAGRKAKTSTAYEAAIAYLSTGIELLPNTAWESHYALSLALHEDIAEASYLNTDFEQMESWADLVIKQAKNLLDTIKVQQTRIMGAKAQGKPLDALNIGLQVLKKLGIEFPDPPTQEDIHQAYQRSRSHWIDKPPQSLIDLPTMSDPHLLAAMNMLTVLTPAAYVSSPNLMLLLIFKQVEMSIKSGNAPVSIFTYGDYGIVLCGMMDDITNGYEFGELASKLLEKFSAKSFKGRSGYVVNTYIKHWKISLSEIVPCLQAAYYNSSETGDLESLGCNAFAYCIYAYHQGQNLTKIVQTMEAYRQTIIQYKLEFCLPILEISQQTILSLLGQTAIPDILTGEIFNQEQSLPQLQATHQRPALFYWFFNQSILYYIFGKNNEAIQTFAETAKYLDGITAMFIVPLYVWFDALIQLAQCRDITQAQERESILLKVQQHQEKLHYWATLAPVNHQHRWELIEAERYRVIGNRADAVEAYDRAIITAKANGFIQDEALANELAAKFYLNWGKEKIAADYMQAAYYCYAQWGAKAKVADLETCYPHLLRAILPQTDTSISILSTLATISPPIISSHTSTRKSSSNTGINQSLDFSAILKATQALSSTIQFEQLIYQLTQIILQNSGADRCALILPSRTGEWQVRAIATPQQTQLCTEPLTNNPDVPVKLIQYVKNTQEVVVIDNMETSLSVIGDYLRHHQPKSVLCLPLLHQGHLIGILYLKNQLTCGVFTEERILILNFLCTQAAISLENAHLYQQLQYSLQDAQQKSQDLAEVLALSNGQQQILALIAQGVCLKTILAEIARFIESHTHHPAYCSFLLIDAEGRLRHGAAPSLPADYNTLIDGIKIGTAVGSCGTAAYCKASVTVTDIATDPLWANYRVALDFGLRACTSTPILGAEGQVLATLAMYQPVAGEFTLHDRQLMEVCTYLARIAIERHQADIQLQNTQLQIVQGEKMASLGNLVAGVAHEINNPIGFLNGSINNAKDYVQDLLEYIETYHQHQPPTEAVAELAGEIELDFLSEDLPKLLDSMQGATDRIKDISTSLRTFSRADTENKVSANLHDGLNSTLLILKYRLKANEFRPAIAVIQDYEDLPEIECFPGQLNQVFMNILANAIDMFDEMAQTLSFEAIKAHPQQITIHTQQVGKQVKVSIRDNGKGMSQELQAKIFEHSFTTKAVGKGTGLGLAIAHQIVVEKHGGRLEVQSQLGQGSEFCIYLPIGD